MAQELEILSVESPQELVHTPSLASTSGSSSATTSPSRSSSLATSVSGSTRKVSYGSSSSSDVEADGTSSSTSEWSEDNSSNETIQEQKQNQRKDGSKHPAARPTGAAAKREEAKKRELRTAGRPGNALPVPSFSQHSLQHLASSPPRPAAGAGAATARVDRSANPRAHLTRSYTTSSVAMTAATASSQLQSPSATSTSTYSSLSSMPQSPAPSPTVAALVSPRIRSQSSHALSSLASIASPVLSRNPPAHAQGSPPAAAQSPPFPFSYSPSQLISAASGPATSPHSSSSPSSAAAAAGPAGGSRTRQQPSSQQSRSPYSHSAGDKRRHSVDYLGSFAAPSSATLHSQQVVSSSDEDEAGANADYRYRKASLGPHHPSHYHHQPHRSMGGGPLYHTSTAPVSSSRLSRHGGDAAEQRISPTRTRTMGPPGHISTTQDYDALNRSAGPSSLRPPSDYRNSSAHFDSTRDPQRANSLEAKIVLLGRQGVGKTSLVHRYMTGQFSSSLPTTIGASFLVKKLVMDGVKVKLQIWDTAGQERFRSMAPMYYRGAHAAILVYDITSEDSLDDIKVWLDELRQNMSSDLIIQIVGHKADLAPLYRKVPLETAKRKIEGWLSNPDGVPDLAQTRRDSMSPTREGPQRGLSFSLSRSPGQRQKEPVEVLPAFKDIGISEVSAKEDQGIEDLFLTIADKLVERKVQIENDRLLRSKDSVMLTRTSDKVEDATRVWGCC